MSWPARPSQRGGSSPGPEPRLRTGPRRWAGAVARSALAPVLAPALALALALALTLLQTPAWAGTAGTAGAAGTAGTAGAAGTAGTAGAARAADAARAAGASAAIAAAAKPRLLDFSVDERQRIASHGPWPPAPTRDAGNAMAGRPAAIALGQRLFFETRLSGDGRFACASCHQPDRAFTDGLPRAIGRGQGGDGGTVAALDRNTPTLWDADQQRWLGWDGAFDSLWSQALHPLLSPREMAATPAQLRQWLGQLLGQPLRLPLRQHLRNDGELACRWRALYGGAALGHSQARSDAEAIPDDDNALSLALAKPLAAFVGTLRSGRSAFDRFRDALLRGDARAAARYPLAAQRGLRLFIGRGQCSTCHSGPLFSHGEFGDIGAPFFVRPGVVDPGRHGGIQALQASRFNLLGLHSDYPDAAVAGKTRHVLLQHRNFGEFKVPSLRNLVHTAPYLHDGQLGTLAAVVDHYSTLSPDRLHADGELILKPLHLSESERGDLLAFLRSLSAPQAGRWQAPTLPPCPSL